MDERSLGEATVHRCPEGHGVFVSRADLGIYYVVALGIAAVLVARQFWIARTRVPADCFEAFLSNQWVGMAVFVGIAGEYAIG